MIHHMAMRRSAVAFVNSIAAHMSSRPSTEAKPHKVVIIGSGPAAHTAAIYCARANMEPVLYEGFMAGGVAPGGQLTTTTDVENFPGFPDGIRGPELMDRLRSQSLRFNTQIHTETVSRVDLQSKPFKVWLENKEDAILTSSLIIATGATAKRMNIAGEDKYWQAGISACAVCDGAAPIFKNKTVAVVGGGDSACEEAVFLTKYASKVYLLVRRDKLRASKVMADRLLSNPKIQVLWNKVPVEAKGDRVLKQLVVRDTATQETSELDTNGLFYAIGHKPNTDIFEGQIDLDGTGYIKTVPGSTLTNIPGVFACGDVQDKRYRQAITAAGSGCMAALDCEKWLESLL